MEDTGLLFLSLVLGTIFISHDDGVLANNVYFEDKLDTRYYIERKPLTITCFGVSEGEATIDITRSESLPSDFKTETSKEKLSNGKFRMTLIATKESADMSDSDNYLCSLKGNSSPLGIAYQYLEVVPISTRGANVTEGHETSLGCEPQGSTEPVIMWFKDGVNLNDVANLQGRVQYSRDNRTVTFIDAKPSDGGQYSCRIDFTPFHAGQLFWENVTLQAKPYIQNWDSAESLLSVSNTSIVLKCPAGGYPPPQVFWFRGDDVIETSPNVTMSAFNGLATGQLTITMPTEAEFGQYTCTAENSLGKAAKSFDVKNFNSLNNGFNGTRHSMAILEMFLWLSVLALGGWLTT